MDELIRLKGILNEMGYLDIYLTMYLKNTNYILQDHVNKHSILKITGHLIKWLKN